MQSRRGEPSADRRARRALADAEPACYWLDSLPSSPAAAALVEDTEADLLVVGGGFTGLWAAVSAKEADPDRDVVLLERDTIAAGATGRNGGFCDASLTHGLANGIAHFPGEMTKLVQLGHENFAGIGDAIRNHRINCDFEQTGVLSVAVAPHLVDDLDEEYDLLAAHGEDVVRLDADEVRSELDSPTYLGGVWQRSNAAVVDPAKLARGLADAAASLGVRIHERTGVTRIRRRGSGVEAVCEHGTVRAAKALLATNAYRGLLGSMRRAVVPVWDYALMTEPLTAEQLDRIGWRRRMGVADTANQFHYYRLTADNRILWGGYDAVYYYGGDLGREREQRLETEVLLSGQFFETFPQLGDVVFTHRWGGPIATTTRFCVTFGTGMRGRVAYSIGYTGLGVAASRFGGRTGLALLDGAGKGMGPGPDLAGVDELDLVSSRPFPFPPEPLRWVGITLTRRALARADRRQGRRGPWLSLLDRFGVGFDS